MEYIFIGLIIIVVVMTGAVLLGEHQKKKLMQESSKLYNFYPTHVYGDFLIESHSYRWMVSYYTGTSRVFHISEVTGWELVENGQRYKSEGGLFRSVVGGALFGGTGALIGATTANRVSTVSNLAVNIYTNDLNMPLIVVHCLHLQPGTSIRTDSTQYANACNNAHQIMSVLQAMKFNYEKTANEQYIVDTTKTTFSVQPNTPTEDTTKSSKTKNKLKKYIPILIAASVCVVIILSSVITIAIALKVASYINNETSESSVSNVESDTSPIGILTPPSSKKHITYPMKRSPITLTDISVVEDTATNNTILTAKWNYNTKHNDLTIDKIVFVFNGYCDSGTKLYCNPIFSIEGPFDENSSYENTWTSDNIFSRAEISKIEIHYSDDLIEEYTVVTYETQSTSQTSTTETQSDYTRSNSLENCPIKVTSYYTTAPNSADGVSLYINWYSEDEDEIKYIYFYVTPYNRVNDVQRCEIRDYSTHNCYATGPYYYGSSDYSYWDCIWYNSSIDHVEIDKIIIEYMDGNRATYLNYE